jgi:hypothetical protein
MSRKHQNGAALLVSMVALIVLTVLGMATMGDMLVQSTTIRNEQFRQTVFYAASSELNAIIGEVNSNDSSDDDALIDSLFDNKTGSNEYEMQFGSTTMPTRSSTPDTLLRDVSIQARRNDLLGCSGESVGKVKVLVGEINATARLDDGKPAGGIRSTQQQRFVYCWP